MTQTNLKFGALVISLDFEIHWGVRDHFMTDGIYRQNLLGVRRAVPEMLKLFSEFDIAATWATVGFLFAKSKDEIKDYTPRVLPAYYNKKLSPYGENTGDSEKDDLFHFAPSLIKNIKETARQEIATHTFSHYYCLENGQTRETFSADLDSAIALALDSGTRISSIVFPRNHHNGEYDDILLAHGINCFRGNQPEWIYRLSAGGGSSRFQRLGRFADSHLNLAGLHLVNWSEIWENPKIANVRAGYFLRPVQAKRKWIAELRFRRLKNSIREAAKSNRIIHLWWHPHNFGVNTEANLAFLRRVLEVFRDCRENFGMKSLSMAEAAEAAKTLNP